MKRIGMLMIVLAVYLTIAFPPSAFGTTWTTASCSRADVNSYAGDGANSSSVVAGDTVVISSSGSPCTWTSQVVITKGIHLRGQGDCTLATVDGKTNIPTACPVEIVDNITKNGTDSTVLLLISVNAPNNFELSHLQITGMSSDTSSHGHVSIGGTMTQLRVHHVIAHLGQSLIFFVVNGPFGLFDHIYHDASQFILSVALESYAGSAYGDGSWAETISWEDEKAIYLEDSVDHNASASLQGITDCHLGGRFIIRHNAFTNVFLGSHGTDTGHRERGCRQQDVYENTFSYDVSLAPDNITWIRGGTGVFYNNTVSGAGSLNMFVKAYNCRDAGMDCAGSGNSFTPWLACEGAGPYDQNSNADGYRCVDQPGSGTSNDLGGTATPPDGWVGNALDPIYVWNNTTNTGPNLCSGVCGSTNVVINRDYYNGTQRPSYSAFGYPHLLQGQTPVGRFMVR